MRSAGLALEDFPLNCRFRLRGDKEERATENPVKPQWLWCLDSELTPCNCIFFCKSIGVVAP